eukprot:COSAG01_NODE_1305_length_10807_cov_3.074897_15_plen_50_part_00
MPDEGCKRVNVVLDRMPIGPIQSYTYSMVGADHFIYCIFEPSAPPRTRA